MVQRRHRELRDVTLRPDDERLHSPQRRDQPQRHIGADMRRARRAAFSIDAQRRDAVASTNHDLPRHPRLPPRNGHGQAGRSEAKREDQGS